MGGANQKQMGADAETQSQALEIAMELLCKKEGEEFQELKG